MSEQSKNVEHYRNSTDPQTPELRLYVERDEGLVMLYEADMTSRSPTAQIVNLHDKIIMLASDARWLRDTLNSMDLEDGPDDAEPPLGEQS